MMCTGRRIEHSDGLAYERLEANQPIEGVLDGTADPMGILGTCKQECISFCDCRMKSKYLSRQACLEIGIEQWQLAYTAKDDELHL